MMSKYTALLFIRIYPHCDVVASTAVSLYVALHYSWIVYTHTHGHGCPIRFFPDSSQASLGVFAAMRHTTTLYSDVCMYVCMYKLEKPGLKKIHRRTVSTN